MILVMLGTQNNSFHRLLEEIEKNIEKRNNTRRCYSTSRLYKI